MWSLNVVLISHAVLLTRFVSNVVLNPRAEKDGLVEKYLLFIQGQHAEHQRLQGQTMMNDDFSNLLIIKSLTTLEFSILAKSCKNAYCPVAIHNVLSSTKEAAIFTCRNSRPLKVLAEAMYKITNNNLVILSINNTASWLIIRFSSLARNLFSLILVTNPFRV